jgi:hypothetical protein
MFCVKCYTENQFVDVEHVDTCTRTKGEMVELIHNRGYQIGITNSYEEGLDLFDMLINRKEGIGAEDCVMERVTIPQHPTSFLLRLEPICSCFGDGGCSIHDEKLSPTDVIQILKILVGLVNINKVTVPKRYMTSLLPTQSFQQ